MTSASNPSAVEAEPLPGRRGFLRWLTYGLGVVAAAVVGIPFVGYLFGMKKAPVDWLPLGPVEDFPLNETRRVTFANPIHQPWDGIVANTGVYVRYQGREEKGADATKRYKFLILAVNCAHLGCPVEWFAESGLFMCPCHGGVYYANGERASGPPPRGLFRWIAEDEANSEVAGAIGVYRVTRVRGLGVLEIQAPHYPTLQDTLQHPA